MSDAGHDHGHDPPRAGHRRPLAIVLGISGTIVAVEVAGAVVSGSLALLADAGHMLTDAAGLSLALVAAMLADRPATQARTWGYRRAEVLAAAAQAAALLAVGGFILAEAIRRLIEPSPVASDLPVLTAHVVVDDSCFRDGHLPRLPDQMQRCLAGHFDVEHSTVQFEPASHAAHEHAAHA